MVRVGADTSDLDDVAGKVDNKLERVQDRLNKIGGSMTAALTLPIGVIAGAAFKAAVEFDNLERGLRAVAGSSEEASRQLTELRDVARLPGLGLQEAIRGATRLQAAGLAADTASDALRGFGNALATVGAGREELDGVIMALTQIQAKGKVSAEEINQLAERVPQIREVMAAAFGTADTEELQKMGLSATEFIETVVNEMLKLPPVVPGIGNALENLRDTTTIALRQIGDSIAPVVEQLISVAVPAIEEFTEVWMELPEAVRQGSLAFAAVMAAAGPVALVLSMVSGAAIAATAAVAGLAGAGAALVANWDSVVGFFDGPGSEAVSGFQDSIENARSAISRAMDSLQDSVSSVMGTVAGVWNRQGSEVLGIATSVAAGIVDVFGAAVETAADVFGSLVQLFTTNLRRLEKVWDRFGGVLTGLWSASWDQVRVTVTSALSLIADVFGAFVDAATGDWDGFFSRLKSIAYTSLNFIANTLINAAEVGLSALQALFGFIPSLAGKIEDFRRRVSNLRVELGTEEAAADLTSLQVQADGLQETLQEMTVEASTEEARSVLDTLQQRLEGFAGRVSGASLGVDTSAVEETLEGVRGQVETLRDRLDEVPVGLDKDEAHDRLNEILEAGGRIIAQLEAVPLNTDTATAERQLAQVQRAAGKLKADLSGIEAGVEATAALRTVGQVREDAQVVRTLLNHMPATVQQADNTGLRQLETEVQTLRTRLGNIPVKALDEEARAQVADLQAEAGGLAKSLQDIPMDLNEEGAAEAFQRARERGAALGQNLSNLTLDIDTSAFTPKVEEAATKTGEISGAVRAMQKAVSDTLADVASGLQVADTIGELFGTKLSTARDRVDVLQDGVEDLVDEGLGPMSKPVQAMLERLQAARKEVMAIMQGLASAQGFEIAGQTKLAGPEQIELNLQDKLGEMQPVIAPWLEDEIAALYKAERQAAEVGQAIMGAVSTGIADAATAFGQGIADMVSGAGTMTDVLRGVAASLITTLADLAIKVGKMMIGFGIAGKALQQLIKNPVLAIAAGSALVALGSFAKSAVSNAISGAGGAGGGAYGGGGYERDYTTGTAAQTAQRTGSGGTDTEGRGDRRRRDEINVTVELQPQSLPSGDVEYSAREGARQQDRYGTEVE